MNLQIVTHMCRERQLKENYTEFAGPYHLSPMQGVQLNTDS